jgi:hypothetical protein
MRRLTRKGTMASVTEVQAGQCRADCIRRLSRQWHHRRKDGNRRTGFSQASQVVGRSGRIGGRERGPVQSLDCEHPGSGLFPCGINRINNVAANSEPRTERPSHRGHKPGARRTRGITRKLMNVLQLENAHQHCDCPLITCMVICARNAKRCLRA